MSTVDPHFIALRARINQLVLDLDTPDKQEQLRTDWKYGALGAVPAATMFICENPSLTGMRNAAINTVDGGPPDIEAQWWGGPKNNAARRFRRLLVEHGLKSGRINTKGGWNCYITNVIKEANLAGNQRKLMPAEQRQQADDWSGILHWEIEQVQPERLVAVGNASYGHVQRLQRAQRLPDVPLFKMSHYSQRRLSRSENDVLDQMRGELKHALAGGAE